MSPDSDARFLDIDQVRTKPGGTRKPDRATIWRWVKNDPEFPKPVRVGPNMVRWVESEIDEYFARKIARRDDPAAQQADRARIDKSPNFASRLTDKTLAYAEPRASDFC